MPKKDSTSVEGLLDCTPETARLPRTPTIARPTKSKKLRKT
jgi:hypothetical protein